MPRYDGTTLHNEFCNGIPVMITNRVVSRIVEKSDIPDVFHASFHGFDPTTKSWKKEGFYISYNNYDIGIYGCATTALVWGQMMYFMILNGDHRKAYEELTPLGFEACYDYFKANRNQWSKYSEIERNLMTMEIKLAHPVESLNFFGARFTSSVF